MNGEVVLYASIVIAVVGGEDKEGREFVPDANGNPQNVSKE